MFVKQSITTTRGFTDDKRVPEESVIGSGLKGPARLRRETGKRRTDAEWKKEGEMDGMERGQ